MRVTNSEGTKGPPDGFYTFSFKPNILKHHIAEHSTHTATLPSITTPLPSMKATRERPSQFLKESHTRGCWGWKEVLGGTQTGSYQTGSYQKGRFIPPKPGFWEQPHLIRPRLYASEVWAISFDFRECGSSIFLPPVSLPVVLTRHAATVASEQGYTAQVSDALSTGMRMLVASTEHNQAPATQALDQRSKCVYI